MNTDIKKPEVSAQDLAILGGGTLSYIREIGATDTGLMFTVRDLPESERPANRLRQYGPGALSTTELLAIILRTEKSVLFIIPWGTHWIIGTTDTDYDGVIEDVRTEPAD